MGSSFACSQSRLSGENQAQHCDGELAVFNYETHTYTTGIKAFKSHSSASSSDGFPYFIFIGVPFWSVNPGAFPEEVKSEQTTIKLIEAARYQLRCGRPLRRILHWPCRTRAGCYLSKFNLWPAAADPAAASLCERFLIETLAQETLAGLITMLLKVPLLWVRCEHPGLAAPYPSAPLLPPHPQPNCSLILLLGQLSFNSRL